MKNLYDEIFNKSKYALQDMGNYNSDIYKYMNLISNQMLSNNQNGNYSIPEMKKQKEEWHFLISDSGKWGVYFLVVCNNSGGYNFDDFGRSAYSSINSELARHGFTKAFKEISFKEALHSIRLSGRGNFCEILGIEKPTFTITDEMNEQILISLKEQRAFNGDSAYSPTIELIEKYEIMAMLGKINSDKKYKRFWLI